ncbi:hypothetical protein HYPSUDRAFT_862270 [Hypholoma sublateritium FD-334 SS-4]|uniref:Uncharacterized protein n=1 Tax=Hypholoma sublateritium (strain FD-334 SS-4) TaxID=945553 RepID=A0A0D2Q734_HYPSF|nr:hypothetical protein HYPSUDRAFT_862270 [Hypholoma sublateritium FD-334 SS-4]
MICPTSPPTPEYLLRPNLDLTHALTATTMMTGVVLVVVKGRAEQKSSNSWVAAVPGRYPIV